jgi:hypothetical protein
MCKTYPVCHVQVLSCLVLFFLPVRDFPRTGLGLTSSLDEKLYMKCWCGKAIPSFLRLYARVFLQHQREHAAYACRLVVKYSIFTCSSDNLLALALIVRVHSICRASKCLLNGWSWFRRDIEFRKFGSHLEDIHSCGIENLFGRGYCYSQVRVLSKSRDEKHEATSLDLHFGEVCAAGGDIGMPPVKGVSRKFVTDFMGYKRVCCTYAMLCL